jgi:HEPN domain-containing protein
MPPELAEVRRWLEKAENDWRTVHATLEQEPPISDAASFHVQQCIEKTLKAYLVWREQEFEKTHDLRALVELCADSDAAFLDLRAGVQPITAYAVRFRYPVAEDPTLEEVRGALVVVETVRRFVAERLPPEVVPPCT